MRSIIIAKIKTYNFNKRMKARPIINTKIKINKASSKNNAACSIKDSSIDDACTSTDDLIVKKYVDPRTSTNDLIVKNHINACTSTDDVCTNENEPFTNENEPCSNENEPYTNKNEPCTNKNEPCTNENEPCTNENEPCTNENDDSDDDDSDDNNDNINDNNGNNNNDDDNSDNDKLRNFNDKVLNNLIIVSIITKKSSINIEKIIALINKADNISKDDLGLKLDEYKKLNILVDDLIHLIWILMYGTNRVNNEINDIDADKEKDANRYVHKYINIVNDKVSLLNNVS